MRKWTANCRRFLNVRPIFAYTAFDEDTFPAVVYNPAKLLGQCNISNGHTFNIKKIKH